LIDSIRRFIEQCTANDFRTNLESLVDGVTWKIILLRAKALYTDSSSESRVKLQDINELSAYVLKPEDDDETVTTSNGLQKTSEIFCNSVIRKFKTTTLVVLIFTLQQKTFSRTLTSPIALLWMSFPGKPST
jgi:hypothetical protein